MNCRHLNKFMCKQLNFKSMSTFKKTNPEQLYCCFNKDPSKTIKSLKFVPKEKPPKLPVGEYHDEKAQKIIYNRMVNLYNNYQSDGSESQVLSKKLRKLINSGQRSYMNLASARNLRNRNMKYFSRQRVEPSKSLSSQKESTPSTPVKNSKAEINPRIRPAISGQTSSVRNFSAYHTRVRKDLQSNREAIRERHDLARHRNKGREEPDDTLEIALEVRDKLENLSQKIKSELMRIDDALRERIKSKSKRNSNKRMWQGVYTEDYEKPRPKNRLDLMPVKREPSLLSQLIEHSRRLQNGEEQSVLGVSRREAYSTRRNMHRTRSAYQVRPMTTSSTERWARYNFTEKPKSEPQFSSLKEHRPEERIIQISTKDAADEDGVYFAPKSTN